MRTIAIVAALSATVGMAGCEGESALTSQTLSPTQYQGPDTSGGAATSDDEAEIQGALAKLTAEDRKLAERQRWCAVQNTDRLGSMGTPPKIIVDGQPVFLCCKGCQKAAQADPSKTLAIVKELQQKAMGSSAR